MGRKKGRDEANEEGREVDGEPGRKDEIYVTVTVPPQVHFTCNCSARTHIRRRGGASFAFLASLWGTNNPEFTRCSPAARSLAVCSGINEGRPIAAVGSS